MTIPNGLYSGSKTATAVDTDLISTNIRSTVNIFGVAGNSNVVNTSSGDAVAGEIASGKKAWVDGSEVTGTGIIATYPAPVPKTGQTTSDGAGDDGDLQKGVTLPLPRFTDNGNGTVTDNLTGLMWIQNPDATQRSWLDALVYCNDLTTAGQTDWRLPNRKELLSLVDLGQYSPCLPSGHLFSNVQNNYYWSSTIYAGSTSGVWYVHMYYGDVNVNDKFNTSYVWPVRGGQ